MNITNYQDLESQGISLEQIKTSLEVTCFGKKFSRHLHVPKSFQSKIANLAEELEEEKISYFITETNFSYTLWREKKSIKPAITSRKQLQSTVNHNLTDFANQPEKLIEQKNSSYSQSTLVNSPHNLSENEPNFFSKLVVNSSDRQKLEREENQTLTMGENKDNDFSVSESIVAKNSDSQSGETIKYRGVSSTTNHKQKVNLSRKKRVITYRGVSREV